jgi:N12 class adenine-specific DNA methylase
MENSQLRVLYQDTLEKITKSPTLLQAFLTQNSYLHQLPFEEIVQIHGQNRNATLLKTWEDWKIVGSVPLKGQTALQSLKEFNNRYSKRNNYFDVAQLAHKNIDIEETILTTEHVKAYLSLNKWNFDSQEDTLTNYLNFLKKVSVQALNNFEFLTPDEKQIVPLVAQYNLVRTYNLALDDDLSLINNEVFKALNQENIRIDRVIKIGNNLSTKQVELISEQKELIDLAAQNMIEENIKNEFEIFEKNAEVEKTSDKIFPAFNAEQIWAMKEIIPTFFPDFPSEVTDDDLVNLVEKMRDDLATDNTLQSYAQINSYRDFEFLLSDKINEYLVQHSPEQRETYQFLLNHQPIDFQRVIGEQIYEGLREPVERSAEEIQESNISSEEVTTQSEEVPIPQKIVENVEEYKEMIERGYSQLYDSYMHYQDLKLNGQNVSGAYDTFDFQTNTEKVQLGFNYIGREQGTDDDSKVVFWASTDTEAYSTDPMSIPIRSRIMPTFEEALQTLNFEIEEQPLAADEKINKDVESTPEIETNTPISQFDEKELLKKIKNDFNLDDEFVISENNGEIALQKVSFGGVLTEFVVKLDSGDIEISDVADSITNIKNFTAEAEKIIDDFRNGPTEQKISSNDEVVAEDNSNDIKLLSDEALEEQIIENYGRMVGAEGNGYSPNSFSRWAELREEENRRRAQNETKEISLFDEVETDSKAPTDEQLYRADEILSEMIEDVEQRQPQIMSEWSGGLQHLKLSQMVGQKREVLVTLDLQSGQLIPDETFLDKWTIEQKEMLRQRLSEVMDIPYEAKPQLEVEAPLNNEPLVVFEFPEDLSEFYPKTPTEKVNANLQAIQLVKQIDVENRGATPAEQDILAKYVGWGGLANEFFDENRLKFASQRQELKTIVSDKEYQAMRESSLTAYYTDPMIIRNMYKELEENGFKGGRILDPAMGTGNFFSAMPKHLRENSELYGVELDTITGSIAKLLHPQANIKIQGFETVDFNPDSFDVVVGNVPFANFTINDARLKKPYLIHDYFFKKSLNIVRPGGLVSFITSTGTMDKRNSSFRKELHQEAGLIGAIRLPNTAFKAIAGTDIATDILTLQKGQTRSIGYWEESSEVQDSSGEIIEGVQANQFFSKESSLAVLGTFEVKNFNGKTLSVRSTPDMDIISEMDKARAFHHQLIPGISSYYSGTALETLPTAENSKNNLSHFVSLPEEVQNLAPQTHLVFDDKIYFHDPDDGIIEKNEAWYKAGYKQLYDEFDNPKFDKLGRPKMGNTRGTFDSKTLARLKGMTQISKKVEAIVNYQIENPITEAEDVQFEYLLKELNKVYDDFINDKNLYLKSGNALNNPKNTKIFEDDINFYRMLSIENEVKDEDGSVKYVKGDFFFKKTISPATQLPQINNVTEGLDLSINLYGNVNLDFIGEQLSLTPDEVIADLGDAIYLNPETEAYETASEYLSGNLNWKLNVLNTKLESGGDVSAYSKNKAALENSLPPRLSINEIDYQIGTRWIPIDIYQNFLHYQLNNSYHNGMDIEYNSITATYRVTNPTTNNRAAAYKLSPLYKKVEIPGRTSHNNPIHLFEDLLNLKNTKVMDRIDLGDGKEKSVVNPDLTIVAREHQQVLQNAFHDFVNADDDIVKELEEIYNNTFNSTVVREYDGSNLTFDYLSPNIIPRPHQKNAVSRVVQEKRGLLDHVVGSGKTITMVLAGRKLKQMGFSKKPCYVVPKAVLNQFAAESLRTYPDLNIIVPTEREFSVSNRKRFMAKVQTGNYDAVFLSTEQFGKIPLTKEREEEIIQAEIDEIISVKNAAKAEKQSTPTIKQLVKLEKGAKERLHKLQTRKDDTAVNFEATGIDFLFVDEAHLFKNLSFQTNITDVKGINATASKRASDMLGKIRYLQELHNGGGVVFATGTPISNSMAEMYTMMKYLMPDLLEQESISNFDSWASTFGEIETKMEVDQTGQKWKSVSRFARFHNVTELLTLYGQVADTQTQEMLDLPVPKVANDGKPFVHASDLTEAQSAYMEQLISRSENMPNDPSIDNMLKLTTDARLMATDMRLIDEQKYDKDDSLKGQQVAETVHDIWERTAENRSTQLIFSDIGTPKGKRKVADDNLSADDFDYKFSVYSDIRQRLENLGIPSNEIAFIHDYPTDKQRASLFDKVRKGEIRVLFASTQKGGTGVNIQDRLVAVHHVDAPWKPSDIEQRNGRIIRQGNLNPVVEIHHYVTTGTFDTFMWQIQEQKLTYINQIRTRKSKSRTVDDLDELVLNASEIKAIATKNPFIREKMDLENKLVKISILRNNFFSTKNADKREIQRLESNLPGIERYYEKALEDSSVAGEFHSMDADNFSLKLDGHFFTNKTKAGEYISQRAYHASETVSLGKYGDFELLVKPNVNTDIMAEPTIYLVGKNSYSTKVNPSSGSGTMIRIDNLLKRTIVNTAKNQGEQIEGIKLQLEQLKAKENLTFEKEEEFQQITHDLSVINTNIELGESVEKAETPMIPPSKLPQINIESELEIE